MSMVAMFEMICCRNRLIFGRFRGNRSEMYRPSLSVCPFGCSQKYFPSGQPQEFELRFLDYIDEKKIPEGMVVHLAGGRA